MGFFSDLLGGESKTGMKASLAQNDAVRGQMHDVANASRDALFQFLPRGMENQRQAGLKNFRLAKQTPQRQMAAYAQANVDARRAALQGLRGYEAAIMGDNFQPMTANPLAGVEGFNNMFQGSELPHFMKQPIRNPKRNRPQE